MKWAFTKSWGMILLGIWLILMGLRQSGVLNISTSIGSVDLLGILAIVAGILVLIGR
jgi:uncharacterized membrane protein HdeD (DUF308 family)